MFYNSSWAGGEADSVSVDPDSVDVDDDVDVDSVAELVLELELVDGLTGLGAFGARLLMSRKT